MKQPDVVRRACHYWNYKWPEELWTGIMYFDGETITIEEFNAICKLFREIYE